MIAFSANFISMLILAQGHHRSIFLMKLVSTSLAMFSAQYYAVLVALSMRRFMLTQKVGIFMPSLSRTKSVIMMLSGKFYKISVLEVAVGYIGLCF